MFDAVAVSVSEIIGMVRSLAVRSGQGDRQDTAHQQVFAEPVALIPLVSEQCFRLG